MTTPSDYCDGCAHCQRRNIPCAKCAACRPSLPGPSSSVCQLASSPATQALAALLQECGKGRMEGLHTDAERELLALVKKSGALADTLIAVRRPDVVRWCWCPPSRDLKNEGHCLACSDAISVLRAAGRL